MAKRKKLNEDQPQDNIENTESSDDTFGLPEVEYEPIKREEQAEPEASVVNEESTSSGAQQEPEEEQISSGVERETFREEESYTSPFAQEEESSVLPKVLGVLAILLVVGAAIWYFVYYQPKQKEATEKARMEQLAKQAESKRLEDERIAREQQAEEERRKAEAAAAQPTEGTVEVLSERTGRYYVVVASAVDDDLIMDYATKLKGKGVSSKIIPPFGKHKFYRIAVADTDTFADAQTKADGMKGGDFGDGVWVIKY